MPSLFQLSATGATGIYRQVFSLPKFLLGCIAGLSLWAGEVSAVNQWRLTIDDIVAPTFSLKGIQATLNTAAKSRFDLTIATVQYQQQAWQQVRVRCLEARIETEIIECRKGLLELDSVIPLRFQYQPRQRRLKLTLSPQAQERWQVDLQWHGAKLDGKLAITQGEASRINPWLSATDIRFNSGKIDAALAWKTNNKALDTVSGQARLEAISFSDPSGNHAGEKISGEVKLHAEHRTDWQWHAQATWPAGEVFWAPFYLASAERSVHAQGRLNTRHIQVETGKAHMPLIGTVDFSGVWDRNAKQIASLTATADTLDLDGLYRIWIKPMLRDSVLGKLVVSGTVKGALGIQSGAVQELDVTLTAANVRHEDEVFSLTGVNAHIPWQKAAPSPAQLRVAGGQFRDLTMGAFQVDAQIAHDLIDVAPTLVPVLDGALSIDSFHAYRTRGDWAWELSGAVRPISMAQFTKALGWPVMHGTLSGVIPKVSYANRVMEVGGGLLVRLFDGTAVVKDVRVFDALGPASRLLANIDMQQLDLDLLTRAFSFGNMQGRLDVQVSGLELANWKPVKFDAKVASSPGEYPRKISQRAVENITALGGASGAAALQRSFLRFFDQFGYERIGLSCRLENDVCQMGGIEDLAQGFLIVKGGGIPALSVIGYNQRVSWSELLTRLARATKGNKPIVK